MADDAKDDEKGGEVRFSVNNQTLTYLNYLRRNTTLGTSANEVARQIFIQRVSEMRQEDYRDNQRQ